jgi:hypothetical protein
MEHAILVYLALALVAYPFLFLIYEIWRHGGVGQTVPYMPGLWSKVCKLRDLLQRLINLIETGESTGGIEECKHTLAL